MSKITEGWSQLCQQLSSSLEQPNPQWLSQQSRGPVSDTLRRSPCLQHQLCPPIQQLRPAFHPQATAFHPTFFLQSHSCLQKRQAQSWRVLHPFQNTGARAQQSMESRYNSHGCRQSSDKKARGSRRKHQSCGYFCPGKAALLYTSISIHSLFLKGFSNHAAQPSKSGVAGHRLVTHR